MSILSSLHPGVKLCLQESDQMPAPLQLVTAHPGTLGAVPHFLPMARSPSSALRVPKLDYRCREKRLSGKMSNVPASSLNQTQPETSFSQGILMLQVLVPTGIKVVKQLPSKLSEC